MSKDIGQELKEEMVKHTDISAKISMHPRNILMNIIIIM